MPNDFNTKQMLNCCPSYWDVSQRHLLNTINIALQWLDQNIVMWVMAFNIVWLLPIHLHGRQRCDIMRIRCYHGWVDTNQDLFVSVKHLSGITLPMCPVKGFYVLSRKRSESNFILSIHYLDNPTHWAIINTLQIAHRSM